MSDPALPNRPPESRMTLRTYQIDRVGRPLDGENQLHVSRPRNAFDVPSSPLFWPACRCPKCREGDTT